MFDQEIWWEPRCGHSSVWFDNWTQMGALHYIVHINEQHNLQLDEDWFSHMLKKRNGTKLGGCSMLMGSSLRSAWEGSLFHGKKPLSLVNKLPTSWAELVFKLNQYSSKIGCKVVYWKHPSEGSFKCNTDGACKGNPGPCSGAYCVRDAAERFIYAKTKRLGYYTNLIAELKASRLGLE
ncbi:hypothetical protein KY289_023922 [Solanum tuberosum]|nr:hypothetical protein KY289_023922 [Solanum tuberosum]